jgi:hypothetical protein
MKIKLIILMVFQFFLFTLGVYCLSVGKIYFGLFHIVINTAFFVVNIYTLKRVCKN